MATDTKKSEKKVAPAAKTSSKEVEKTQGMNGLAVTGFVLSLCGFFTGVTFIIGLILSAVGLSQTKKTGEGGRGMALAGTIIGAIGTAFTVLMAILLTVFLVLAVLAAVVSESGSFDRVIDNVHGEYKYTYSQDGVMPSYDYELICD